MSKNNVIIALVVLCLVGTIWGSVQDKKSISLERQLVALKAQTAGADTAASADSQAEVEKLTLQNQTLLADAATLKESVASLEQDLAAAKEELVGSVSGSQDLEAVQAQLDARSAEVASLEEAVTAAKATIVEKESALAAAKEASAGLENMQSTLANSVDAYSAKSQELSAEVEEYSGRIQSLENALEERTKILIASGEELSRTKLNMNVLLSRIAAQNNSIDILEETRVSLEKELSKQFQEVESLRNQLHSQVAGEEKAPQEEVSSH